MLFSQLDISSFRNIAQANLVCAPSVNFITGSNGTGKTAVLESIYLLGSGRSFRTHFSKELIQEGKEELLVRARFQKEGNREHQAAVLRNKSGAIRLRLDHDDLRSTGELARLIPLMVIHPGMTDLVLGGPGQRRRFVDWGLFHVEQCFLLAWKNYQQALEQRNALLKQAKIDATFDSWTESVARFGQVLSDHRVRFTERLLDKLGHWCEYFHVGGDVSVTYKHGWDQSMSLEEALDHSRQQCLRYRTTSLGPHRADLRISLDGFPAKSRASRGQIKMLIYAMVFAQLQLYRESRGEKACLLCDDPSAELDNEHQQLLLSAIRSEGLQCFMTGVDFKHLPSTENDATFILKSGVCARVDSIPS